MSVTLRILCRTFYKLVKTSGAFSQVGRAGARAGAFPPVDGPTWAQFSPVLFTPFLFPFLLELKQFQKIVENAKNARPILLDS
jgi:hypothetical protein